METPMASDIATLWDGFPEAPFDEIAAARPRYSRSLRIGAWINFGFWLVFAAVNNFPAFTHTVSIPLVTDATVPAIVVSAIFFVLALPLGSLVPRRRETKAEKNDETYRAEVTEAWRTARYPSVAKQQAKEPWITRLKPVRPLLIILVIVIVLSAVYLWRLDGDPQTGWFAFVGLLWGLLVGPDLGEVLIAYGARGFSFPRANDTYIASQLGGDALRVEIKAYYDWQRQYGNANG
jgi:hypothetical protein